MTAAEMNSYHLLVRRFLLVHLLGDKFVRALKDSENRLKHLVTALRKNSGKFKLIEVESADIIASVDCLKAMLSSNQIVTNAPRHNSLNDDEIQTLTKALLTKLNVSAIYQFKQK